MLRPPSSSHRASTIGLASLSEKEYQDHHTILLKGFDILTLAGTFVAAIQAQVMSATIGLTGAQETHLLSAVNALFIGGLVLDLMAASLAFLTSRILQRLTPREKDYLELAFGRQAAQREHPDETEAEVLLAPQSRLARINAAWCATSLFAPMPLLAVGVACMLAGLLLYTWSQHATAVAVLVSAAFGATVPFAVGVFSIGREEGKRRAIIGRLSVMQGDW